MREIIESVSAKVHENWMEAKRAAGVTTRRLESGEELMVPYAELSEAAKELDRGTVRTVLGVLPQLGYALSTASTPARPTVGAPEDATVTRSPVSSGAFSSSPDKDAEINRLRSRVEELELGVRYESDVASQAMAAWEEQRPLADIGHLVRAWFVAYVTDREHAQMSEAGALHLPEWATLRTALIADFDTLSPDEFPLRRDSVSPATGAHGSGEGAPPPMSSKEKSAALRSSLHQETE